MSDQIPAAAASPFVARDYVRCCVRELATPPDGAQKLENGKVWLWDFVQKIYVPIALKNKALITLEDTA